MDSTSRRTAAVSASPGGSDSRVFLDKIEQWLPKIVVAPTFVCSLVFVYGFILWNAYLSFTPSRMLPNYEFAGLDQYEALFANERWWVALTNLALFGGLFIFICVTVGLLLAILLDQKVRAEGFIRSIYLY